MIDRIVDLPKECADELHLPAAIVIGVNETGDIVTHSHGFTSHLDVVQKLAVAIHAVLGDHDKAVLVGKAGPEAQARFKSYSDVTSFLVAERVALARAKAQELDWIPLGPRGDMWATRSGTHVRVHLRADELRGYTPGRFAVLGSSSFVYAQSLDEAVRGMRFVEASEL